MAKKLAPSDDKSPDEDDQTGDDLLKTARDRYDRARDWWNDNMLAAEADMKFGELDEQWPEAISRQRLLENRPCLTFNRLRPIVRQVVNDARQNKPAIKVHPQGDGSDPQVAEIIGGLIRNIEVTSDADIAYDTAITHAVGRGFGYWRINTAYTCDDAFDQDIVIERIANPFTVFGDPNSTAADSSDWNQAFIVTTMTRDEFEDEYPDAEKVDWEHDFANLDGWLDGENVVVAEYWTREKVKGQIVGLSDGSVVKLEEYDERADEYQKLGITPIGKPRDTETYKVTQRIMSGAEILKTVEWAGKYIPIVPVYGDEIVDEEGKRYFWSLIRGAKSAQEQYNYWETTRTELVALAPKAPFIGEEDAFSIDPNWSTANEQTHPFLMVPKGVSLPQRQQFAGVPPGALQEALHASDNIKATTGIYDASMGARSNETSGRAIMARQREGDVSTFHFIDNLNRAIRHGGRILLDLIPKVYSTERMIRILGEDLSPATTKIAPTGQPVTPVQNEVGQVIGAVYDITAGKYDLTVSAGPSFTSRREEVREIMMEAARMSPEVGQVLVPRIAKLMDLPDAEEIAQELKALTQPQQQQGLPPEVQQQMQQGMQMIQQLQQENAQLKQAVNDKQADTMIQAKKVEVDQYKAETERMKVGHEMMQPTQPPRMAMNG